MKEFKNILFWGSIWGILEATVGWGLHLIHFKGEALVLYPFGLICMLLAMRQEGGGAMTTLKVAGVAALIKLINLITWPGVPAYYVVNPAVAIFLEGMVTFVFYSIIQRKPRERTSFGIQLQTAFLLVLASFLVFKGWQVMMDRMTSYNPDAHLFLNGEILWLWIWKSAVQGFMLVAALHASFRWKPSEHWRTQTVRWSFPILIIAVLTTLYI